MTAEMRRGWKIRVKVNLENLGYDKKQLFCFVLGLVRNNSEKLLIRKINNSSKY